MSYGQGLYDMLICCFCSIIAHLLCLLSIVIFVANGVAGFWSLICSLKDVESTCSSSFHYRTCCHNHYYPPFFSPLNLFIYFYSLAIYTKKFYHKPFSTRWVNHYKYFLLFYDCYNNLQSYTLKVSVSFIPIRMVNGVSSFWSCWCYCCWDFYLRYCY